MKIERTKNAVRNIITGILLKIYLIILPFIMKRLIIQILGVEYLGLDSLFVSILQVLNLVELGVGSAMVYSMYKPIAEGDNKKLCALLNLYRKYYRIIGFAILIVGIILIPFLPRLVHGSSPDNINIYILYIISLLSTVVSYWFFAYRTSILQSHQRNDIINLIQFISTTIRYLLQGLAIALLKNYYIYSLILLITQLLINVFTLVLTKRLFPHIQPIGVLKGHEVVDIRLRVKDIFTSKLGGVVITSADTIVISSFLGLAVLGVYQNYMYIITAISGFFTIAMDSFVAGVGNSLVVESEEKNYRDFKGLSFVINWLCCFCICCLINMYQNFIELWVGSQYKLDYSLVILLAIYFYMFNMTNYWCVYKNAAGIWHQDRYRPLIGAFLNLVLNLSFVKQYGLYAIQLSTIISYAVIVMPWLLVNMFKYIFKRSLLDYIRSFLLQIVVIGICVIISRFACKNIAENSVMGLIFRFGISSFVSVFLYGIVFCKTEEYIYFGNLLRNIFKSFV